MGCAEALRHVKTLDNSQIPKSPYTTPIPGPGDLLPGVEQSTYSLNQVECSSLGALMQPLSNIHTYQVLTAIK